VAAIRLCEGLGTVKVTRECVPQPAVSSCNKMRSRSSRSFSDHVQIHPVVDRAARSEITTMAVRIKVMVSSAMSLAV